MRSILICLVFASSLAPAWSMPSPDQCTSQCNPIKRIERLFQEDQDARSSGFDGDWDKISVDDAARRKEAATLIANGDIVTADDYYHAAYIFQHGDTPEDYLKAHALATASVLKGRTDAAWIAAATLDRYLQSTGKPQIFGTQYKVRNGEATQEPYDRSTISDSLRAAFDVRSLEKQEETRAQLQREAMEKKLR